MEYDHKLFKIQIGVSLARGVGWLGAKQRSIHWKLRILRDIERDIWVVLSCDIIQNQLSNADHYSSQLVRGAMISQLSELYFTISLYGQLNSNACL